MMAHNYEYVSYEDPCINNYSQIGPPAAVPLFTDSSTYHQLTTYGPTSNFLNGKIFKDLKKHTVE